MTLVVALLALLWRQRGAARASSSELGTKRYASPGAQRLVDEGRFEDAARLALRHERWDEAIELYRAAGQPANAAHAARRGGLMRQAAELYEMAGDKKRAAECWDEAGVLEGAGEILADDLAIPDDSHPPPGPHDDDLPSDAETEFRTLLARISSTADVEEQARLQDLARDAAEKALETGDMKRAADIYRDAGLHDEAVHLYVNVLGSPGEAAPLLAARGNHRRAAELYELAGTLERAAAQWVEVARVSDQPGSYLDKIEGLSADVAFNFLELETKVRPVDDEHAELHYRFGVLCRRRGDAERAAQVLEVLLDRVGDYKDAREMMRSAPDRVEARSQQPSRASVRPVDVDGDGLVTELSRHELATLVVETSRSAATRLRKVETLTVAAARPGRRRDRRERWYAGADVPRLHVSGMEVERVTLDLLRDDVDPSVLPSVETLLGFVENQDCSLANIEVYYLLGQAHLLAGRWDEALQAFEAVEDVSPGYRDAYRRAEKIIEWRSALGARRNTLGGSRGEVGRYELLGEIGRGGMAVVYRARDRVLDRDAALKFMAEEISANAELREMFHREARSVAGLNHPNVVTIYDFGMLEGRAFICMEYVDGKPLDELVDELTVVESLGIAKQTLEALHFAHGRGIIHRDVKPANIMRTGAGLVKLMDFGLAKSVDTAGKTSMIAGTPAFMPPEQLFGGQLDHRVDIFAMGVTLYELLTRELPFEGMARDRPATCMRELVPAIPELVDDAVMRALALEADARWPTAQAFAAPLASVLAQVGRYAAGRR